ncbi:MAG: methyltransferase [Myxococcota bacterium]
MGHAGDLHARKRLTRGAAIHFQKDTLFDRLARVVCQAGCLPRKELYESWEVARRVQRRMRGGRVVDLACGHGLLGAILLILDRTRTLGVGVDRRIPPCTVRLRAALEEAWPFLSDRWRLMEGDLSTFPLGADDVVVSAHACGGLSDLVLERAAEVRARVAVMPCCHAVGRGDLGGLTGWLSPAMAMDVSRAAALRARSYHVHTQTIPEAITPQNRLLFGVPVGGSPGVNQS